MKSEISLKRKIAYYSGTMLIVVGVVLFISTFFSLGNAFGGIDFEFGLSPFQFIQRPLIGMICMMIGGALRTFGALGAFGSGVLLDPKKAREDLKPYSQQVGGMVQDALEQIEPREKKEIIKIKCTSCGALNQEDAVFCAQCGERI